MKLNKIYKGENKKDFELVKNTIILNVVLKSTLGYLV